MKEDHRRSIAVRDGANNDEEEIRQLIERIRRMEELLDTVLAHPHDIPRIRPALKALSAYYESGQWLADYEADEQGLLPPDLKRGVLGQDTLYNLLPDYDHILKGDSHMKQISHEELPEYGITTNHNIMDNGERRFRLGGADGSVYIRTEASEDSGWQNSHYHTRLSELCIVQSGWVYYAELIDGQVEARKYTAGEHFIIRPMIAHNSWMAPNSILHTVKFGDCSNADWIPAPELDELVRAMEVPHG